MSIEKTVFEALEEITGLPADDLGENREMDLLGAEILDSLSCASLAVELEERLGRKFKSDLMTADDFVNVNAILAAVSRILG